MVPQRLHRRSPQPRDCYTSAQPLTPPGHNSRLRRRSASPNDGGVVLPSIEGPNGAYSPTARRFNPFETAADRQNVASVPTDMQRQDSRSYRDRDEVDLRTTHGPNQSRAFDQGPAKSALALDNPFREPVESPRARYERIPIEPATWSSPRQSTGITRRILIPDDDPRFEPVLRNGLADNMNRVNPFNGASSAPTRRLEPLPTLASEANIPRRSFVDTPPRRILEPIPMPHQTNRPSTQVYREYLPSGQTLATDDRLPRRIVYPESANYPGDRR